MEPLKGESINSASVVNDCGSAWFGQSCDTRDIFFVPVECGAEITDVERT